MTFRQPLELQYWLVQVLSGSWDIFTLVGALFFAAISAMFKINMGTFIVILVLFAGVLLAAGQNILMIMAILILAPILFLITRRLVE